MTASKKSSDASSDNKNVVPDKEVRKESSKAANQAISAQRKAKELKQAAAGAGDPDERQKLMEQAIDAQVQAESFGKTAKYMRSGTFQGLAVGTGLGVAPGATLGALTGTLVGGVTSTITGGLGGGIGAAAGAMHGPIWNIGEVAGKGIQKVTGNLPGWEATEEQKKTLEKMTGQIKEEDMPDEAELEAMTKDIGNDQSSSWTESVKSKVPSMQTTKSSNKSIKPEAQKTNSSQHEASEQKTNENRKQPRKLEVRSNPSNAQPREPAKEKKRPRKIEKRSS